MKTKKSIQNNKGFSLVEIIVSMTILAIIAVPLLSYFVSSAKYNAIAKNKEKAVVLAQSIMEQCKDEEISNIAESFHTTGSVTDFKSRFHLVDPTKILNSSDSTRPDLMVGEVKADGTTVGPKGTSGSYVGGTFTTANSLDGSLYYKISNIQEDGNQYDALISFDAETTTGDTYYDENNTALYNINAINAPQNVAAVETAQQARALEQMISLNAAEYKRQVAANVTPVPTAVTETQISAALKRSMVVQLSYTGSSTNAKMKIYYQYYCDSILGCPTASTPLTVDPPLYNESVNLDSLKNIYLFFSKSEAAAEQVSIVMDSSVEAYLKKFNLYLFCQAGTSGAVPSCQVNVAISTGYTKLDKIYYNVSGITLNSVVNPSNATNMYVTKSTDLRMLKAKVDIYKAGKLLNPDYLYATLESLKGE